MEPRNNSSSPAPLRTAIIGARGYSGLELARLLLRHPSVELTACLASTSDWKLSAYLPEAAARSVEVLPMSRLGELSGRVQVYFLATPAEVSLELAPRLLAQGADVVDLSGAFRITAPAFERWYRLNHSAPALLETAEFGLCPWVGPAQKKSGAQPRLVANPGCYATSILMALLPLLRPSGSGDPGIIDPASLVIDAKSGTSGAGRKANEDLLFTEVDGDCLPYRVGKHQHIPEIIQAVQRLSGVEIDPLFATNLLPVRRGITSGIYARLRPGKSLADVAGAFESAYAGYPLLAHGAIEEAPKLLSLRRVAGSPRTQIAYTTDGNKLYLFSAIDNLLKGAASQAVENLNRLLDLPLETGLLGLEGTLT